VLETWDWLVCGESCSGCSITSKTKTGAIQKRLDSLEHFVKHAQENGDERLQDFMREIQDLINN
jgi:biotin synthase-like enzyme